MTFADLRACARYIGGDISQLANKLGIPENEVKYIQSRFKSTQLQAQYMLKHWHSAGDGNKQELKDILNDAGYSDAAQV